MNRVRVLQIYDDLGDTLGRWGIFTLDKLSEAGMEDREYVFSKIDKIKAVDRYPTQAVAERIANAINKVEVK